VSPSYGVDGLEEFMARGLHLDLLGHDGHDLARQVDAATGETAMAGEKLGSSGMNVGDSPG
jgi:hypothetical protein